MNCDKSALPSMQHIHFPTPNTDPEDLPTCSSSSVPSDAMVSEIVEEIIQIENVTVKFHISDAHTIAQVYANRLLIKDIKNDIARKFDVSPRHLCITQCHRPVSDDCLLLETDSNEYGIHEFGLEVIPGREDKEEAVPILDINVYYKKYRLPDFITVEIQDEDEEEAEPKKIVVEIQNKAIVKPFLCGYRDRLTGIEFHDAFTQTGPIFDKWKYRRYRTRDSQTHEISHKHIDTTHDQTSQCWLDGRNVRYVSEKGDVTIVPKKYQSHAQQMRQEDKIGKIRLIQRNLRRYIIVRFMREAARKYRQLVANREEEERRYKEKLELRIKKNEMAMQFPSTRADFKLLYNEVEKWKVAEMKRIANLYDGASRIAEVHLLLDKEIQMLGNIERQRHLVFKSQQDYREEKLLTQLGEPIKWIGYKDCTIHMDLLRTQRVRFLTEVYKDLQKPLKKEPRLELIQKVKKILMDERAFPEFAELFDLFDREKNLLIYTKHCDVEILRKRQNLLFFELIRFTKDKKPKVVQSRMCEVCKQVKPMSQFTLRTLQNLIDTCKECNFLKVPSNQNNFFTAILRSIQREERKKHCTGSFAFVIQVDDIRHIIEKIWHGHSIISKNDDVSFLRLPRWIRYEDWSPWNCICLTETEAREHVKLEDPLKVYDDKLLKKVTSRQLLARNVFHKLTAVATELLETGEWWKVGMNKQRNVVMEDPMDGVRHKLNPNLRKGDRTCVPPSSSEDECDD